MEADGHVRALREGSRDVVRELGMLGNESRCTGVSQTQCHALIEIEKYGLLSLGDLARILKVDKSTVSRTVAQLIRKGWVRIETERSDKRVKPLHLTEKGNKKVSEIHHQANMTVSSALDFLDSDEQQTVLKGMLLYSKALARAQRKRQFDIRPLQKKDNSAITKIIQEVLKDYGASGPGFAGKDEEVSNMHDAYRKKGATYFVLTREGKVVGGAGVGPLKGGDKDTCELKKMYLLPEARGSGFGKKLLECCLETATEKGYRRCYLETLEHMNKARLIYEKFGFRRLKAPLGSTGHFGCNYWYALKLSKRPQNTLETQKTK